MNFANILFDNPAIDDAATALIDGHRTITFAALRERTGRLAAGLCDLGISQGDRIALLLGNRIEYVEIYLAAAVIGAAVVPLNTRLTPQEHLLLMRDAEPKALFASPAGAETAVLAQAAIPSLRSVIMLDDGGWGDGAYEMLIAGAGGPIAPIAASPDDPAVILYTSGTTSGPKGAILTHRNLLANLDQYQAFVGIPRGSVNLQASPLYHAANIFCFVHLLAGGTTVFVPKATSGAILEAIEKHRVTYMFTVPTVLYAILDSASLSRHDISSLQTLQYGGSAIVGPRLDAALAAFGERLLHSFGMTETTSHASILGKKEHRTHAGSVGRPLPGVEMRIVDDARRPLGAEEIGEIEVKGENVMKGYWRNPGATAETLHDGWLATGDLGRRDALGYYYIVGRKKDLIISGGVNIYPADIENVLAEHPAVAEVAVFGAPDPNWGECVVAAIVPRQDMTIDTDALRGFVRKSLGGFKTPKEIRVMAALPKNGAGKVLKRELRTTGSEAAAPRTGTLGAS
jgi:acyl-CoA synthetase (AMP-forming)/AMP-acid ligase II